MTDLSSQQCSSLSSDKQPLSDAQSSAYLKQLDPQWQLDKQAQTISFIYTFKNYYQTMAFVNVVAQIAHQQDHHPDLLVSYNRCKVTYSTHSVGGLSINDFICAAKINSAQNL
ncbi:MAG: 4a-hydroxytetrahydrobiopterin dehydratase [Gammaproteobacteria bacterium]|nr:4a-hydroxytetrahydrobiopterin dehydratase [Gammaproteobacteria bacterium]